MAIAETAELQVLLSLKDQLSGGLTTANARLKELEAGAASAGGRSGGGLGLLGTGMAKVSTGAEKLGGALNHAKGAIGGLVTGPLGVIGLGAGLFGVAGALDATINASRTFQASMEMIHTQAGATQQEVDSMSKSLMDMAASVGTSPNTLAQGLFHLESAGFRGARALEGLRIAAEGAKVGQANLEDVTNALDAVMVAGGKDAQNLTGSMGELNAIVGAGDMHMQDLADALGTGILAAAHTFHLSLADVGAALATMGDNNIRGSEAATKLRMSISLMGAPSGAATKALKEMGLAASTLNIDMQQGGLIQALTDLKTHLDALSNVDIAKITGQKLDFVIANRAQALNAAQAQLLTAAFGGGKSSTTIQLLLEQLDRLKSKYGEITGASDRFAGDFAATAQTAQFKWDKFNAALGTTAIEVGNVMLPVLTDAMGYIGDVVTRHQKDITGFFQGMANFAREVGTVVKTIVIPALKGIAGWWNELPGQLKELLIAGFVAGKTSKFLFGTNLVTAPIEGAAKGIFGSLFGGLLSKLPGGSLLAGATGVGGMRVFVTNWPGGFGVGLPGLAGAGGAAAGGMSLSETIAAMVTGAPLAVLGGAVVALSAVALATYKNRGPLSGGNGTGGASDFNTYSMGGLGQRQGPGYTPQNLSNMAPPTGAPNAIGEHSALGAAQVDAANKANALLAAGLTQGHRDTDKLGEIALKVGDKNGVMFGSVIHKLEDAIHIDFAKNAAELRKATDPTKAITAMQHVVTDILKGVGNAANTAGVIDQLVRLRDIAAKNGDKADVAKINGWIKEATNRLDNRRFVEAQLAKADAIVKSSESTKQKIVDLQAIQRSIGNRSVTATQQVGADIKRIKSSVTVKITNNTAVTVSAAAVRRSVTTYSTYGAIYGSGDSNFQGKS